MTIADARKQLVAEFRKRGSMTLESARAFLASKKVRSASDQQRVIDDGASKKQWAVTMESLVPVRGARPDLAATEPGLTAIEDGSMPAIPSSGEESRWKTRAR